jgi:hypothetical protein
MKNATFYVPIVWGRRLGVVVLLAAVGALTQPSAQAAEVFASGLARAFGSAVGPGGDLYVADAAAGAIVRVDPGTGTTSIYADGLPISPVIGVFGIGGVMDVTFLDGVAYALVTLVSPIDVGGTDVVGIYQLEDDGNWTPIADIGTYAIDNLPAVWDVPTGVQYAIQTFRGGFLVTDGNHNRLLHVTLDGAVRTVAQFDNEVPTGLAVRGNDVYLAFAGPVPHLPEDGKVLRLDAKTWQATEVANGAPLLVDVEFGRGNTMVALSQGEGVDGDPAGAPAQPDSGTLVALDGAGGFTVVDGPIDLPTSVTVIRNTAYIVSLDGNVYRVPNVSQPPFGN